MIGLVLRTKSKGVLKVVPLEMEVAETSECASAVDSSNGSYLVTIRTNLAFEDNPIFYKVDLELITDESGAMTSNWRL